MTKTPCSPYIYITEKQQLNVSAMLIENDGQNIIFSTYWHNELAENGLFYLSSNAGAVRLLIPGSQELYIPEMKTGKYVEINIGLDSKGRERCEIVFIDGTPAPFFLSLEMHQMDKMPISKEFGKQFPFIIVTHKIDGDRLQIINEHLFLATFYKRKIVSS